MNQNRIIITEENYPQVKHLIPPMMYELISIIGLKPTLTLIQHRGGQTLEIHKGKTKASARKMAELAEIIGWPAVEKLINCYSTGRRIAVSNCKKATTYLKHKEILARFDELTAEKPNGEAMTAYLAARKLAIEFNLTERQIWLISKKPI